MPLSHIKRAVANSSPLGVRRSENSGMEFYSNYFRPGKNKFIPSYSYQVRNYAHILIRGDRRPYTIEIYVYKEKRQEQAQSVATNYVQVGQDERLAKLIRSRIKEQLTKRREDPNTIDDFRVF